MAKIKIALRVLQFTLVVFGAYVLVSLLGLWAYVPFWIKNIALLGVVASVYIYARKYAKIYNRLRHYQSPAEIKLLAIGPVWHLHALSMVVFGGLVFGVYQVESGIPGRLMQALTFSLKQPPGEILLNLTVTPPSYLGQGETIILSELEGPRSYFEGNGKLFFPEGSILGIKIKNSGDYSPYVSLGNSLGQSYRTAENTFHSRHILNEAATLDIRVGPYVSIRQAFGVIPDESPSVAFVSKPQMTKRASLELKYSFGDDHGVEQAYLELSRRELTGVKTTTIELPALGLADSEETQTYYTNLLSHPWAGSVVSGVIKVVDGLGQVGSSNPVNLVLPEKSFQNPAAQTLNSIRQALLITPERKSAQVQRLNTLTNDKNAFQFDASIYLALRSAYWKLRSAETAKDFEEVTRYLWQTALRLEDNGSFEEQNVQAIMERMVNLLAKGQSLKDFDNLAGNLQARLEAMFESEFMVISRRLSLNENPGQTAMPGFSSFRYLISTMREQATEGNPKEALKTLLAFRALFEQRPVTVF